MTLHDLTVRVCADTSSPFARRRRLLTEIPHSKVI